MEQHAICGLRKLYKIAAPKMSDRNPTVVGDRQSNVHVAKNPLQLHSVHIVLLGLTGPYAFSITNCLFLAALSVEISGLPITV